MFIPSTPVATAKGAIGAVPGGEGVSMNIFYIIGVIVVVLAILSFLGLR